MSRDGGAFFSRYRLKSAPCSSRHRMSDRSDMRKVQDVASLWSNTLVVESSCTRAISFSLHALSSSCWSLLMIGLWQVQWRVRKMDPSPATGGNASWPEEPSNHVTSIDCTRSSVSERKAPPHNCSKLSALVDRRLRIHQSVFGRQSDFTLLWPVSEMIKQ